MTPPVNIVICVIHHDGAERLRLHETLDTLLRERIVTGGEAIALRRLARGTRDFGGHWPDLDALARQLRSPRTPSRAL